MARKVQHLSKGYGALLRSAKAQADLIKRAERIAAAANASGGDVVVEPSAPIHTRNRVAIVAPKGDPGNTIIRNLDAGR